MGNASATNVFLVTGDDVDMIAVEAAGLIRELAGEQPDPFGLDVIRERDGAEPHELLHETVRAMLSPPFLGARKTVWLKGYSGFARESAAARPKDPEALALRELAERLARGLPGDIALVLEGPGADPAKPLAKACAQTGRVILCQKPTLRQRDWRQEMARLIERRAAAKGVTVQFSEFPLR